MKRLIRVNCTLCLLAALAVLAGCERLTGRNDLGPMPKAPELTAAGWVNGTGPSAAEMAGKVVVIDVWAFWCGPCQRLAPSLVQTYQKYKDRGVLFVGLTPDGGAQVDQVKAFVDRYSIPWPNGYEASGTLRALGVRYFPSLFVVGTDGRIVWQNEMGGSLEQAIDAALAAGRGV